MSAEPQGAAEMEPSGWDFSGAGIPPVGTFYKEDKDVIEQKEQSHTNF